MMQRLEQGRIRAWRLLANKSPTLARHLNDVLYAQVGDTAPARLAAMVALMPHWGGTLEVCLRRLESAKQATLMAEAERITRHQFTLFGRVLDFGSPINWHADPIGHHVWDPRLPYTGQPWRLGRGVDIKVPWELSRGHQSVTLALAYRLTGNRSYRDAFVAQSLSWMESNPWPYGPNWRVSMEVAIRAINWIVALGLFGGGRDLQGVSELLPGMDQSLFHHGLHIYRELEWGGPGSTARANHYLSNLAGLMGLGVWFRSCRTGRSWLRFAVEQMEREMQWQCTPDGVHFERSTGYHCLCLEFFLWGAGLAVRAGVDLSMDFHKRLRYMQEFVHTLADDAGQIPAIGDNDSGQLIRAGMPRADAAMCFPEAVGGGSFVLERYLLDGTMGVISSPSRASRAYPDGGFFVLRNVVARLVVRAGLLAHRGGHAHNDQLSFTLSLDGREILVDRGTGCYASDTELRNLLRSTQAHNTFSVNDAEQNPVTEHLFSMPDETRTRVTRQDDRMIEGMHHGFQSLKRPNAEYRRRYELEASRLVITDSASQLQSGDRMAWFFHLAPGLTARTTGTRVEILDEAGGRRCVLSGPAGMQVDVGEFPHSPSYGVLMTAYRVVFQHQVSRDPRPEPGEFCFEITWSSR